MVALDLVLGVCLLDGVLSLLADSFAIPSFSGGASGSVFVAV